MDPKIWKNLPIELIRKIVEESEPTIDSRLAFKIPPTKIDEVKSWRLWYLLNSHDGIVYNLETESLHNFRVRGHHIIRRPIKLDWINDGLHSFNQDGDTYMIETNTKDGQFIAIPSDESWLTDMRVLLRGSGLARLINASGATF
jgi:hypothetical protein